MVLSDTAAAQLQGRIVMDGRETANILVTLERSTGQVIHQAFTNSQGIFRVEGLNLFSISNNNPSYLVVNEDGFKPFRRRLQQHDFRSGGTQILIFLELEANPTREAEGDGSLSVDVRQLQVDIPSEAQSEFEAALLAAMESDHQQAIRHLELAVQMAPDYYDAWLDLGGQYSELELYEDAKASYRTASELNSNGTLATLNLGALHYQQGQRERTEGDAAAFGTFSLAQEWLEKTIQSDPTSAAARFYLGATLYRLDLFDESEEMLKSAITLEDGYPDARSMLINVYTKQNRYEAALEQAIVFLVENPNAPGREAIERVRSQLETALER